MKGFFTTPVVTGNWVFIVSIAIFAMQLTFPLLPNLRPSKKNILKNYLKWVNPFKLLRKHEAVVHLELGAMGTLMDKGESKKISIAMNMSFV